MKGSSLFIKNHLMIKDNSLPCKIHGYKDFKDIELCLSIKNYTFAKRKAYRIPHSETRLSPKITDRYE